MSAERGEVILRELVGLFGGRPSAPVKRQRAKPHRCADCKRVTRRAIRCDDCWKKRHGLS